VSTAERRNAKRSAKPGQVWVVEIPLADIRPAPENDRLYRPVDPDDPAIVALARSIGDHGVMEPLVVTRDRWLLSGHRRLAAARLARLKVLPCRIEPIRRADDIDRFVKLLAEYNRQREKSLDERLREQVVGADPEEAHRALTDYRADSSQTKVQGFRVEGSMKRHGISRAKRPMLDAALWVIEDLRRFWPLNVRRIHYVLSEKNPPPLRHADKPDSRYTNSVACYKDLDDLLTRARVFGQIMMEAIADETRPVVSWQVHREPSTFLGEELDGFLKDYYRDLLQSQPNHIEIVGEKNTIKPIIHPVAAEYTIPYTIGRGYASLPPRHELVGRYVRSGKEKLILLMLSDFDPEGQDMNNAFAKSLRDDFGIRSVVPIKVCITPEQVRRYDLPRSMDAKPTSSRYRKFVERYGQSVHEIDALSPEAIQAELRRAIDEVLDIKAFNAEVTAEKHDAAFLDEVRQRVHVALQGVDWNQGS
jgi:hypothetical protein